MADGDAHALAELEVGDAVRGGRVNDAGALIHAHQLGRVEDEEGFSLGQHVREKRLVGHVHEVTTVHLVEHLVIAVEDLETLFREDVRLVALRDAHVALPECTASATLPGSVHGVVVHASRNVLPSESLMRNLMNTEGSGVSSCIPDSARAMTVSSGSAGSTA